MLSSTIHHIGRIGSVQEEAVVMCITNEKDRGHPLPRLPVVPPDLEHVAEPLLVILEGGEREDVSRKSIVLCARVALDRLVVWGRRRLPKKT